MLVIRFLRIGKKNQPSFKIVVTDKRNAPRGGRFIEEVGFYNPLTKENKLNADRIKYWIEKGAKPSDTVHNLLLKGKLIEGKKIPSHNITKTTEKPAASAPPSPETPKADVPKAEKPKEEAPKPEVLKVEPSKEEVVLKTESLKDESVKAETPLEQQTP